MPQIGDLTAKLTQCFGNLATCIARQFVMLQSGAIDFQLQWSNWLIGKLHRPPMIQLNHECLPQ